MDIYENIRACSSMLGEIIANGNYTVREGNLLYEAHEALQSLCKMREEQRGD
ncbi:MAG: hypothetical protein IJV90_02730 [Candidatus Methanomethylophilaceae archaeon]|nr:hypothetical protein [Candidatus Methanomethylophilaceae archaeon]